MQIRYDMKNKLDFSNVRKQATFFLNKENCLFSFYLSTFAVNFSICKPLTQSDQYQIELNFSELSSSNKENNFYVHVNPITDYRFKDLSFIQELFQNGSNTGNATKSSVEEAVNFVIYTVKYLDKVKDLSLIA